jgi:hypothetical protein
LCEAVNGADGDGEKMLIPLSGCGDIQGIVHVEGTAR